MPAWSRRRIRFAIAVALACVSLLVSASALKWLKIAADDIHDPRSPAVGILQEPAEALSKLPPDAVEVGNQVLWMRALDQGYIQPRTNIHPETIVNIRTTRVLLRNSGEMPLVVFPHRQHTAWLDCSNCHDHLFQKVAGATRINMRMILEGEKCGVCHGAVAFPLTECYRCHSVERGSPQHAAFNKQLVLETP